MIGKYVELQDSYKSILEAFIHAGAANEVKVKVESIHSEYLQPENIAIKLSHLDGMLVAPGFGERGIEGKIEAIRYVREHQIPFFGICLGMQMATIEFSRNVLGLAQANSSEMDSRRLSILSLISWKLRKKSLKKEEPCDWGLGNVIF